MGWLAWDRMTGLQSGGTASVPQACSLGFGHGAPAGAGAVALWGVQGGQVAAGGCAAGLDGRNQAQHRNRGLEGGM